MKKELFRVSFTAVAFLAICCIAYSASGTLLPHSSVYPRLVRIAHGPQSADGEILASTNRQIFQSLDDGRTFSLLSEVPVRPGSRFLCCETLFEMPTTVGSLRAGTLLFAASYVVGSVPAIEIYTSTDEGRNWTYSSTPVMGAGEKGHGGLWEPEFSVARDGGLVMFWSDETFLCCSQKLEKIRTFNGTTWQDKSDAVASTVEADRPGMAVVNRMPTGMYFLTYEICGDPTTGHKCAAYFRTSRDGWNYGRASNLGTRIETADGKYFEHAPTNIWSPSPLSPEGVILVVGQVLMDADNSVSAQNGRVIFVNPRLDGSGPWSMISAPVEVPNAYDNYCPNYSSALLPVRHGTALLEFASDYYALNKCGTYFSTKEWSAMEKSSPEEDSVPQRSKQR